MKAIVVGAGIAGLVAARQLGLAGWDVEVLEKSRAPRPDGYMMDFFGPGVEASERIGLYPRLAQAAYRIQSADYVDAEGRTTCSIDYLRFSKLAGGKVLSLLRPDIEAAALAALTDVPAGRVRVRYGARLVHAHTNGDGAHVLVEDGLRQDMHADAIIGADGIHSEVRAAVFGPEEDYLRPLGMRAAAFIVTEPALNARFRGRLILTDTPNRMAGLYGIRQDEVAAFLVYRDAASPGKAGETARQRLRSEFDGLGDAVDRLMDLCPGHPYDDTVAQVVMPRWHTDRAVLVGDACGAVSLLAGQGGSLAIAAAALLGDILGQVTKPSGIGEALARFERQWRPVVESAQKSGRRTAATFLPRNNMQLLLRRWVIRATRLPGVDRWVAHQILRSIAK